MASALYAMLAYLVGVIALFAKPCQSTDRYFIMSQPGTGSLLYIREGETVVRVLLFGGHEVLGPIALDPTTAKLYVADPALAVVYWYQLIALPGKQLITDGRKHTAINGVVAQSLACDGAGNLYIGGQAITLVTPSAPPPPYAIIKIAVMQLQMGVTVIPVVEGIWNKANSGSPPKMFSPSAMFSDGANLFWGNDKQGGSHGTIVKGSAGGGGGLTVVIDQGESATAVGHNGENLFYSTENGIFGASLNKKEAGCGKPAPDPKKFNPMQASLSTGSGPCRLISSELKNTVGMYWDGDGTMYTMDPNSGVYSFPSGNLEPHRVTQIAKASGLVNLQILQVSSPSLASMGALPSILILATIVLGKTSL